MLGRVWERLAAAVTGRRSWLLALGTVLAGAAVAALIGGNDAAGQAPLTVPTTSDSAAVGRLSEQFTGGDRTPLFVVISETNSTTAHLTDTTLRQAGADARDRMQAVLGESPSAPAAPVLVARDGKVAIGVVPISAGLSGLPLSAAVTALRTAADAGLPAGLSAHVTGGPAFGADIANAFSDANVTLLAVTASVVALLLIATYRSPVLWLVPLTVIGFADRVAAAIGTAVAALTGLSFDGSTAGITSVLVFGAGTNYALLLISRYRQELRRHRNHRDALRRAVRMAAPTIVASNATVVLALSTLTFAVTPSTRSLGALGACGLVVAALSVLVVLPPLLALCGRRLFWPFVPQANEPAVAEGGMWHAIGTRVAARPLLVASVAVVLLAAPAVALLDTRVGLSQTEQFRVKADSVTGFDIVSRHFPAGLVNPTVVLAPTTQAPAVQRAVSGTPGVVSVTESGRSQSGWTKWSVVTDAAPSSGEAFNTIAALRDSTHTVTPEALVGGPDAQALDTRDAAAHDRRLLIPAILTVILLVLYVLLRSALAPPTLLLATILGAMAALGLGSWVSSQVLGFAALDNTTPLYAFLFLAALGVDYTIFLVTRAREEADRHGARDGMIRAVTATGGVITSAGIVLAAVFCVLGVLPLIVMTQLGIIVGLGILLDTFLVRTLVIPALFTLIGDRIWWPAHTALSRTEAT